MKRIVVIGAGGFAREVRWLIHDIASESPGLKFIGYAISDLSRLGPRDSHEQVLGDYNWLIENPDAFDALAIGIGAPSARRRVATDLSKLLPAKEWPALIHPSTIYSREACTVGAGATICAGTIATVNVEIGPFAAVNLSCTIGHEAAIGAYSTLNPTVNVSGGVEIGEAVLVGTGAQILEYKRIGKNAVIGAGAVVIRDVAPGETVVGIPAKPIIRSGQ